MDSETNAINGADNLSEWLALTDPAFSGFSRAHLPKLGYFCALTTYGEDFKMPAAYTPQNIANGFGEYIAKQGLKQLRIAETEKYAHVTYFFNGGIETAYPGEDRVLVPSPKVATYDLKPEMSAYEVTDKLVAAIEAKKYDAIVCNFANGDMVGHTGNLAAATRAVEVLDECLGRVIKAMQSIGGEVLITADHGNAEMMHDDSTNQPHTAHTVNRVPVMVVGGAEPGRNAPFALHDGRLSDVAPTLLELLGLATSCEDREVRRGPVRVHVGEPAGDDGRRGAGRLGGLGLDLVALSGSGRGERCGGDSREEGERHPDSKNFEKSRRTSTDRCASPSSPRRSGASSTRRWCSATAKSS